MKKWLIILTLFITCIIIPNNTEAKGTALKDSNYIHTFAEKDGNLYFINSFGELNKDPGIYKISRDLKSQKLIREGNFNNLYTYGNSLIAYSFDEFVLQQIALDGSIIREYPEIDTNEFVIDGDYIYYHKYEKGLYRMKVNGKDNQLLYKPKGYVSEFTVNNGWLYFAYYANVNPNSFEEPTLFNLSKIKISNPSKETVLLKNVANVDSLVVDGGFIYAVVHKNVDNLDRYIYKMDYNGKNLKRISPIESSGTFFVGGKNIYFTDNTRNDIRYMYRMTTDGKGLKSIGSVKGSFTFSGYSNNVFYFVVQKYDPIRFTLHSIPLK
ncbi:DUF5050 domain-containing protein [Lysinibacillus endophyticus]|uniref:DUF5050 domain-containing protein n=1 Tax=Ureibacillus endophyticus TaxID=1978490 RepID=UPI0020A0CDBF|nr:DUF5050 domain-containing protein [Lysinibacillus endophyticus]MCP1144551.1 DUF5050 domain-containing protein [Lysinibacillus endophyticus]